MCLGFDRFSNFWSTQFSHSVKAEEKLLDFLKSSETAVIPRPSPARLCHRVLSSLSCAAVIDHASVMQGGFLNHDGLLEIDE
jgi:hypothetical protein